jgi:hypothetical protein
MFSIIKNHVTIPPADGGPAGSSRPTQAPGAPKTTAEGLLDAYFAEYRPRAAGDALITGDDLIRALGLAPSPRFKDILEFVEQPRLVQQNMSRDEALEAARHCQERLARGSGSR